MFGRSPQSAIEQVQAADWEAWVEDNDAVIVDVRRQMEWALARIPNSVSIPMANLYFSFDDLDKDRPILVVCRTGARSQRAARILKRNGFNVANLRRGMRSIGFRV